MAAGTKSDFTIYDEQFWGGYSETLEQETEVFNGSSNGSIRLVRRDIMGDYDRESFIKSITDLVVRRDVTHVSAVTDKALTQDEMIGVKVNRRIGPVANTLDSLKKITSDPGEMSFLLGQQIGKAVAVDYVNTAILTVNTALTEVSTLSYNASTAATGLQHVDLVRGMSLFGDQAQRIVAWVMHSHSYFQLMENSVSNNVFQVAGATIYEGTVATFGRPVIVTDSTNLLSTASTTYSMLGLVDGAVEIAESEERTVVDEVVTGLENLVWRVQGEVAYNVKIKGFRWNTAGGANPTDSALGTGTNWIEAATDTKSMAGVRIHNIRSADSI